SAHCRKQKGRRDVPPPPDVWPPANGSFPSASPVLPHAHPKDNTSPRHLTVAKPLSEYPKPPSSRPSQSFLCFRQQFPHAACRQLPYPCTPTSPSQNPPSYESHGIKPTYGQGQYLRP